MIVWKISQESFLLWNGWANSQSNTISWERDEYYLSQIIHEKTAKNLPKALSCEFIQQTPITGGSDNNQNTVMIFFPAKETEFLNNWLNSIEKEFRNSLPVYMKPSSCSRINLTPLSK